MNIVITKTGSEFRLELTELCRDDFDKGIATLTQPRVVVDFISIESTMSTNAGGTLKAFLGVMNLQASDEPLQSVFEMIVDTIFDMGVRYGKATVTNT